MPNAFHSLHARVTLDNNGSADTMLGNQRQPDFEDFRATQLYCPKCGGAMPVRKKLLLVLLDKEIHDLLCAGCGSSLGKKEEPALSRPPLR